MLQVVIHIKSVTYLAINARVFRCFTWVFASVGRLPPASSPSPSSCSAFSSFVAVAAVDAVSRRRVRPRVAAALTSPAVPTPPAATAPKFALTSDVTPAALVTILPAGAIVALWVAEAEADLAAAVDL